MNDNPYSKLIGTIKGVGEEGYLCPLLLGKVIKPLPNIEIMAEKMPLYKDDLLIDKWLLDRSKLEFECSSVSSCSDDKGHRHTVNTNPRLKEILQVGDMVLLARFKNESKLVIISKVVNL